MNRQFKEYIMRCMSAKWSAGYGVSLRLKDSHGEIRTSFWAGDTGMLWDAFGLSRGDDLSLAVGKEVIVWFNVNGMPTMLKAYPNEPGVLTKEQLDFTKHCNNLSSETLSNKDIMVNFLREEKRIKLSCDYAIASKYGEIHIVSHELYAETIKEVAEKFELPITSFHTWS